MKPAPAPSPLRVIPPHPNPTTAYLFQIEISRKIYANSKWVIELNITTSLHFPPTFNIPA